MIARMAKPLIAACLLAAPMLAAATPTQTRLIVPYPAGGASDFLARAIQPLLSRSLGEPVIVENVGGASGAIGSRRMLQSPPDGHTLLLGSPNEAILVPMANKAVPYKPGDFRLVGQITQASVVLLGRPGLKAETMQQLADDARRPGAKPLTYGSTGVGSLYQILGATLSRDLKINMVHVPYRGAAPLLTDLMGNVVDLAFLPVGGTTLSLIQEKKLKVYGLAQAERKAQIPQVPTLSESDPELKSFAYPNWAGLLVRADTPDAEVARLQKALATALTDDTVRKAIESSGPDIAKPMDLQQAKRFYQAQVELFGKIIRDSGVSQSD